MLEQKRIKGFPAICGSAVLGLLPGTIADAANPEPVTVDMDFIDPITITENNPLQFGLLDVNMASGDRVIIAPDSSVSDNKNNVLGGTQAAANLTVTAQASQTISILADNASTATGYSLDRFECNYNSSGTGWCDGSGSGYTATAVSSATLLIGARLTGNGSAVVGTDNSTFDVTVTYQ